MALSPGTPKLESRSCPETVPGGVSGLWELITPDCKVWSQRGLNQTCSPRRHLSNDVSHSQLGGRKEVDSRLLVVGSQIASLTPGPSFAHNLGDRCPNGQCEAIFDIYASRPFQWYQEHLNARWFGPCCWALNILTFSKCWASPPHLAKVGLWHLSPSRSWECVKIHGKHTSYEGNHIDDKTHEGFRKHEREKGDGDLIWQPRCNIINK
jgi:hypothetical protein